MFKMNFLRETVKMNASEYKKYHESFMENNHGSTLLHTVSYILFTVQCCIFCSICGRNPESIQYTYEYVFMVLTLIAAQTSLAEHIYALNLALLIVLIVEIVHNYQKFEVIKTFSLPNVFQTEKIHSISCMRGLTYLITVFCILAVDFKDFPRYLAKTERYGYSVMDTGVGLFVLMSGLVHKDLRRGNTVEVIKGNSKFICILLLLGAARYVSVKQLDYQEHVTEYGVHWNFFFTLAVCKFFSSIILFVSSSSRALLFSTLTLVLHELILHNGLQDWVFSDTPRTNLITANREGIASSLGYISMYLFAVNLKKELNNTSVKRYVVFFKLFSRSILLYILSYIINNYRPTSRTLANAGYCIYLEAILMSVITILYVFEALFQDKDKHMYFDVPMILSAINDNGLVYFLIANLLTGAINMSVKTLLLPSNTVFHILNVYMLLTITMTVFLRKKGIKI